MSEIGETERIAILLQMEKEQFEKNARSAAAIVDRLEKKFDPLAAAEKRLEAQQRKLNAALAAGTIDAQRHQRGMDLLQRQFSETSDRISRMSATQVQALGVIDRNKAAFQQLGYQVGDAAVQIQGGTSAITALTQQGSQMLGVLGPMGAVMGAALAVGVPLAAAFLGLGDEAEDAAEDVQEFADKLEAARGAIERAEAAASLAGRGGLDTLKERYGEVTVAVTELADAMAAIERRAAELEVRQAVGGIFQGDFREEIDRLFGDVGAAFVEGNQQQADALRAEIEALQSEIDAMSTANMAPNPGQLEALRQMREEYAILTQNLANAGSLASEIAVDPATLQSIRDLEQAAKTALAESNFAGFSEVLSQLRAQLQAAGLDADNALVVALVEAESVSREAANRLGDAQVNAAGTADAASNIVAPVSAAADEAGRLSGNLASAMANLASVTSGIATAQRRAATAARIAAEFAGDPVGRAGAETRAELNEASGAAAYELIRSGGSSRLGDMADTNTDLVSGAQEVARLELLAEKAEQAAREAAAENKPKRSGGRGGGGRGRVSSKGGGSSIKEARKEAEKAAEGYRSLLASLDPVAAATQRFEKAQETVNEALQAGQINSEQAAHALDLAEQQMRESIDAADELAQQARNGAEYLSSMFMGIVDGSTSAKDALAGLLMKLAEVQMQKAFLGLAEGGIGGGLFSGLGQMLSGARAAGGPVAGGRSYLVGEEGPEIFTPNTMGSIIPNHGIGGSEGAGGVADVRVFVDQDGNWQAAVERISDRRVGAAAPRIQSGAVAATAKQMRTQPKKRFGL